MQVNRRIFYQMTGRWPTDDDLERCNCIHAGELMHLGCGVCAAHRKPMFECGCALGAVLIATGAGDSGQIE